MKEQLRENKERAELNAKMKREENKLMEFYLQQHARLIESEKEKKKMEQIQYREDLRNQQLLKQKEKVIKRHHKY